MPDNPEKQERIRRRRQLKKPKPPRKEWRAETQAYFKRRQEKLVAVATTTTASGQTLDWIEPASQVPGGATAEPPPSKALDFSLRKGERMCRFELEEREAERGPEGTVPILRKDVSKLRGTKPLKAYLAKHRRPKTFVAPRGAQPVAFPEVDGSHRYASSGQMTMCWGGEGIISAFDPYTETSEDFSLLQIALTNADLGYLQTLEAGWQESEDIYGDWLPHLFLYYTTNGYSDDGDDAGGYNTDVDGWVQYDSFVYPGAVSSPNSVAGGDQKILMIKYQWWRDQWWFNCNGRWLGYYPSRLFMGNQSVFSTLGDHATAITFFGEIFDSDEVAGKTTTNMGSGYWPEDGWKWSAYMRNLKAQTDRGGGVEDYHGGTGWASDPDMYDIETHFNSGSNWGSYCWLGGPGRI